jgi:hypothetical protein
MTLLLNGTCCAEIEKEIRALEPDDQEHLRRALLEELDGPADPEASTLHLATPCAAVANRDSLTAPNALVSLLRRTLFSAMSLRMMTPRNLRRSNRVASRISSTGLPLMSGVSIAEQSAPRSAMSALDDAILRESYDQSGRSVCGESYCFGLWYEIPFDLRVSPVTVVFNVQPVLIHKYRWSSP